MVFGRSRSKHDDGGNTKSRFGTFTDTLTGGRSKSRDREKSKTQSLVNFDQDRDEYKNESKYDCRVCGRQFIKSSLRRHEPVCQKTQASKRKVFDSGKQRAQDSDIPISSVRHRQRDFVKRQGKFSPPKTRWKEKSSQVRSGARQGRVMKEALRTGGPMPEVERSQTPDDFVQCDYCGRKFNEHAAERHVPYCKKKNNGIKQRGAGGGDHRKVEEVKKGGSRSKSYASSSRSRTNVKSDESSDDNRKSRRGSSKSQGGRSGSRKKKSRSASPRKAKPKSRSRTNLDKSGGTGTRLSRR